MGMVRALSQLAVGSRASAARTVFRSGGSSVLRCCHSTTTSSSARENLGGDNRGRKGLPEDGKSLRDFMATTNQAEGQAGGVGPEVKPFGPQADAFDAAANVRQRKVLLETYGCQMNVSDSEIVRSILLQSGFALAKDEKDADIILINTCAIRDNAEQKIWNRLEYLKHLRLNRTRKMLRRQAPAEEILQAKATLPRSSEGLALVGVMGCMAERLKRRLVESDKLVDIVVGPDAYRDLPRLIAEVEGGQEEAVNTLLSLEETYADINPVRVNEAGIPSAYVSIMRGCDNYCAFCIVPFTRGRERSRDLDSITDEVKRLEEEGYKEVVLLGQNVNSYCFRSADALPSRMEGEENILSRSDHRGFTAKTKVKEGGFRFVDLVDRVSAAVPEMRIRYTSPHPKDFPDPLLDLVKERPNVCKSMHMPAQSGSSSVLEAMRRGYTREAYLELAARIREKVPGITFSSDFISGFCGETEEDHLQTISLMQHMKYEQAFMFAYSMRERTLAHKKMVDDVPQDVKIRRLNEVIATFHDGLRFRNNKEKGRTHLVLIEGTSRKSAEYWTGRTDTNRKVVFPKTPLPGELALLGSSAGIDLKPGDYAAVTITGDTLTTLLATPIARSTIGEFSRLEQTLTSTSDSFLGHENHLAL